MTHFPHRCHARRCDIAVPPSELMCIKHWRMVPEVLRDAIWATYRRGQEIDKNPSEAYLDAAFAAIEAVDNKERQSWP